MKTLKGVSLFIIILVFLSSAGYTADIKVDTATFGSIKARMIGPAVMSGRVTAIDCSLKDTRTIYVGTASGGVWKSVNGGISFKPVFNKYTMSIGCLVIDQKNPDTVWVGTGECNVRNSVSVGTGLYRTVDGGKSWSFMGLKDSERISKIIVDPKDSKTVYVAVMGHLWNSNKERGVYKTTDGGKSWGKIFYIDENTGCADLEIDPQESDVLYAAMWQFRRKPYFFNSGGKGSGLYKSLDKGKNWSKIQKGLPKENLGRIAIAVAPSRPGTLYATVESKKSALYRSDEMGENWKKINVSLSVKIRPFYFAHLVVDPKDYKRIYFPNLFLGVSKDGGKNIAPMGNVHSDIHAVWVNPHNPKHLLVGTDGGVYISNNQANDFVHIASLPVSQFYHVSYDMEKPYNVYGGLQDNGSWYGPSRNYGSSGIKNKDWHSVGIGDGFYVFRHPNDFDIIYYEWQGGRLSRYNERTKETKDIQPLPQKKGEPEYRYNWNAAFALSPTDPELIYMGAQFLFKSSNRGDTWEKISPDLTTNNPLKLQQEKSGGITIDNTTAENHCTIFSISQSPLDQNLIWVGTDDGNLQVTADGGKTWENTGKSIPSLPEGTWCSSVEAGHFDKSVAYATFDGHRNGDKKSYVYKTTDYGKTWESLSKNQIQGYCHIIREDLVNSNLIFLGTEFGLYVSIDSGKRWTHLEDALPKVSVRDLAIHPREHDLIIATHGLGIQIIDDITPLRALEPKIIDSVAHMLPSRTSVLKASSMFQEFPGDAEFVGRNPQEGAVITYYLKKRHIFGNLKLEILDSSGSVIKSLPTSKRRGVNRVYWNMRLKPPKTPSSPGLPRFFSFGPRIDEGIYTVRLSKGKNQYTGKIEVIADPVSAHSKEDRRLRYATVIKLYNLQEELGYITESVSGLQKQIDEIISKKQNNKTRARLEAYKKKLEKFHKSIVQYGGIMTGEKLREKVMGLYSSVIQYGGKPTDAQIYYTSILTDQVRHSEQQFLGLTGKELKAINLLLKKKGFKTLELMARSQYKAKD